MTATNPDPLDAQAPAISPTTGDPLVSYPPSRGLLLATAGAIGAIYLGSIVGKWWPSPDSALYLSLARSMVAGEGYRFNEQICNTVTPGLPLILAALRMAFGTNYWMPKLFVVACALGTLAIVYRVIARQGSRRTALAVIVCCALSYTFCTYGHRIMTGVPFTLLFWATLAVCLQARRKSMGLLPVALLLACVGLTIRIPGVMLLGPLAVGLMLERPRGQRRWRTVVIGGSLLGTLVVTTLVFKILGQKATDDAPLYMSSVQQVASLSALQIGGRLARGMLAVPSLLAEMLTSQKGMVSTLIFGLPATVMLVVGGVGQWRSGRRLAIVTVLLSVVGLALLGDSAGGIRPRYLLPAHPLIVWLVIDGWFQALRAAGTRAALVAATVFTIVVVGTNAPRLLRNVVYYTYLSYTPQYYQLVRGGDHAEWHALNEQVRRVCPPDRPVAMSGDEISIVHYLTERRVIRLPQWLRDGHGDFQEIIALVHDDPDIAMVLVDKKVRKTESRPVLEEFSAALEAAGQFERIPWGRRWDIFRRKPAAGPAPAPATAGAPTASR